MNARVEACCRAALYEEFPDVPKVLELAKIGEAKEAGDEVDVMPTSHDIHGDLGPLAGSQFTSTHQWTSVPTFPGALGSCW